MLQPQNSARAHAVESAGELPVVPNFEAVCVPELVQLGVREQHFRQTSAAFAIEAQASITRLKAGRNVTLSAVLSVRRGNATT